MSDSFLGSERSLNHTAPHLARIAAYLTKSGSDTTFGHPHREISAFLARLTQFSKTQCTP